jgi:hypothetical protein
MSRDAFSGRVGSILTVKAKIKARRTCTKWFSFYMGKMRDEKKIETELLRICRDTDNGARLSRFEDWAAMRSPEEVEYGRRFLSSNLRSITTGQPLSARKSKLIQERRKDPRFPLHCTLTVRNLTQCPDWQAGTLEDISARGMLIKTCERFALKDAVEIWIQDAVLLGEVVHYRQAGRDCLVGIMLSHSLKQQDLDRAIEGVAGFH